jgi:hypothetical protein
MAKKKYKSNLHKEWDTYDKPQKGMSTLETSFWIIFTGILIVVAGLVLLNILG